MPLADAEATAAQINECRQIGMAGIGAALSVLRALGVKGALSAADIALAATEMLAHVPASERGTVEAYIKTILPSFHAPAYSQEPNGIQAAAPVRPA